MKTRILTILLLAASVITGCCDRSSVPPAIPQDKQMEKEIDKILKDMTLEEKIGQMTQITIDVILDKDFKLNKEMADKVLREYKVGSILNVPYGNAISIQDYKKVIKQIQDISLEETGIPNIYGLDQIHGATYTKDAIFFPQEVNIAATFNREHARNMGEVIAYETRASNVAWVFSPVMDLGRNPIWPRLWESFGEDTYLNAEMAVAETEAMQGADLNKVDDKHVAACLKHYLAYGVPVSGQDRTPSSVAASDLREKYFEPFKECIQAGALSVMVNSANNNGVPFHCNYELLTTWLKDELNWDGMIVTDWADINNLYTRDRVASSMKEAVKMAINAGIDMSMTPYDLEFCDNLKALVEEGEVPMSRIDDAVRRVLRLKMRLGLFENPYWDEAAYTDFACEKFQKQAYQAAVESEILLKNNGILPLAKDTKILVTGPNANSMRALNGGWSYTWQGEGAAREEYTGQYNTIVEALQNKFTNVNFVPGVSYDDSVYGYKAEITDIRPAVRAARSADVIIACIGENTYCETPGNDTDLNLSENQKKLVRDLAATGKPVILILNQGRPRIISDIEPLATAVVNILLPSNYGADALAALLSGEENFSGKLPFTYPKHVNKWATYDYKPCEKTAGTMEGAYNYNATMDVQWQFGHGLSYTKFEYSNLKVSQTEFTSEDVLKVSVDVENVGRVAGMESVLMFTSDLFATSTPDIRRLRGFDKITLAPGEKKTVELELSAKDLAFVNYYGKWTLEEGEFYVTIGNQQTSIHCTETVVWEEPNID